MVSEMQYSSGGLDILPSFPLLLVNSSKGTVLNKVQRAEDEDKATPNQRENILFGLMWIICFEC